MTTYELAVLVHVYQFSSRHPEQENVHIAEAFTALFRERLIVPSNLTSGAYLTTPKGDFLMKHLLSTPTPVALSGYAIPNTERSK